MKRILLIAVMVLMAAVSTNAENKVSELVGQIHRLQHKIYDNTPVYNSVYRLRVIPSGATYETAEANRAAWHKHIDAKFAEIIELIKHEDKEVDHIEFVDKLLWNYEDIYKKDAYFEYEQLFIYYTDGTFEYNKIENHLH